LTQDKQARSIAIIGGGQLGYFLCEAAQRLGIKTLVVAASADEPALRVADTSIVAALDDPDLAQRIAAHSDAVTFEFEFVPDALLAGLEEQQRLGNTVVHPDPALLRLIKNKATQKQWLQEQGLPTEAFVVADDPPAEQAEIVRRIPVPLVQKAQQGGYDGYGVQVIDNAGALDRLWAVPSIFEPFLAGVRELAVVAVRSASGEIEIYEPVELEFDTVKNILDAAIAPALISPELRDESMRLGSAVVEKLGGVGVFAIEMFLTADSRLLINEVSPRVHNSGHHTLDSCATSQFEQHVRAVAGLPLGSTRQIAPAVMKNILYTEQWEHLCALPPGVLPTRQSGVTFYWYGKIAPRPGRKMGHVTCTGASRADAEQQISLGLTELQSARNEG
jgi:5-(carboxyamino)imidazole ribonucleotide synthase